MRRSTGREGHSKRNFESNLKYQILPTLGHNEVSKLTTEMLQVWLEELAKKLPVKVQQREAAQKNRADRWNSTRMKAIHRCLLTTTA
jgi:hypothetical protein